MSIGLALGLLYVLGVNVLGYAALHEDRLRALADQRLYPEPALLTLAGVGGSIGVGIGVVAFRHKRSHAEFNRKLTIIIVVQVLVFVGIIVFA